MSDGGYFLIAARWEVGHEKPGSSTFFVVEELGGTLDDAKSAARTYLNEHVTSNDRELRWVEGLHGENQRAYYAHHKLITFRITE